MKIAITLLLIITLTGCSTSTPRGSFEAGKGIYITRVTISPMEDSRAQLKREK